MACSRTALLYMMGWAYCAIGKINMYRTLVIEVHERKDKETGQLLKWVNWIELAHDRVW
jgi:hypothetical protein